MLICCKLWLFFKFDVWVNKVPLSTKKEVNKNRSLVFSNHIAWKKGTQTEIPIKASDPPNIPQTHRNPPKLCPKPSKNRSPKSSWNPTQSPPPNPPKWYLTKFQIQTSGQTSGFLFIRHCNKVPPQQRKKESFLVVSFVYPLFLLCNFLTRSTCTVFCSVPVELYTVLWGPTTLLKNTPKNWPNIWPKQFRNVWG